MIPEQTWSLVGPVPIYVKNSDPPLYWWHGIGMTEPMLLTLIGELCFNILPSPEIKKSAIRSQYQAECNGKFGSQKILEDPITDKFWTFKYSIARYQDKRKYNFSEVLTWLNKKEKQNDC